MTSRAFCRNGLILAALLLAVPGQAVSLRVAPTTLELAAPQAAASLLLRNEGDRPLNAQIRVFRWSQKDGADRLEPVTGVVVSPPIATIKPNADYMVRVVRVDKSPVADEEAYRVVVDELPDPSRRRAQAVNFVLRFSVPLFFHSTQAAPPQVRWTVHPHGDAVTVTATNAGRRHLRVANLQMRDSTGRSVMLRSGLVGYVLGGSSVQWSFPVSGGWSGGSVMLSADSDTGRIDAPAAMQPQH